MVFVHLSVACERIHNMHYDDLCNEESRVGSTYYQDHHWIREGLMLYAPGKCDPMV